MKKWLSLLLAALLALTPLTASAGWPGWAGPALGWAQELGVSEALLGDPDTALTRAGAVRLIYEAAGRPAASGGETFADVAGEDAQAVSWAASAGIAGGIGGGLFAPDAPVTRQEFAAMLHRRAGTPAAAGSLDGFSDAASAAVWARDALAFCTETGVMGGVSAHELRPGDPVTAAQALTMLYRVALLPDFDALSRDLETLTAATRPVGSEGEAAAVRYLRSRFESMGYTVTLQPYTSESGAQGSNVVAVKSAVSSGADILLISAHHDSVPTAPGANDDASGVVAMLAVAQALSGVETDTELRFVSFTDEENGKNGSRQYAQSLTDAERERIIGDIQLDMLGGLGSSGLMVCTTDGEGNWLVDLLASLAADLPLGAETASDHTSLQMVGVPSVLLMQQGRGYLYHSAADVASQLDLAAIASAARLVSAAVQTVASPGTASYREIAREQGSGYTFLQTRQNVIYFGSSLRDTEAFVGAAGELVSHEEISGDGWSDSYDAYRYAMRWFGGQTPMNTYYNYRNGFLENIEIRPAETGYTIEQVRDLITAMYGEPSSSGGGAENWEDVIYSKYISLVQAEDGGFTVGVYNYAGTISNVLASYPVVQGDAAISDAHHEAVWEYLCSILPREARERIAEFRLFTDGTSNILAYTTPITADDGSTDNTRFEIAVDYYDVYDENGAPRDWSKLTYTIIHEYGHALLEDATQIDLTVGENTHDPAGFIPGSFRWRYYERFWKELEASAVNDYEKNPTHYVSRYGANYFHEDVADTFAVFVLGAKPQGDTVAEQKLLFFWQEPQLVALREAIRENLGLSD
ncbi:M20/M25/M40 family metallo-hydrolase [Feifania hominis]|uniref:M20/M25/M40 family metallo-hydrolase n=1 Tax=Feifania hominis TaxID=2763660 RepID=A0A926DCK3_9FIRM|nr:M20/M25/M40 family metallo-hydrolase [Feifania hominis]MBC8536485.1 M20/M25/M40 family metallo-hydrolase [Feifania hominis]